MQVCKRYFDYSKLLRGIPCSYSDDYNLDIKKSSIKGAGNGIFVKKGFTIKKEDLVCEYRGYIVKSEYLNGTHVSTEMCWNDTCGYTILGENITALVNDIVDFRSYTPEEISDIFNNEQFPTHNGLEYNCEFVKIGGRIFLQATRDIYEGEELFVSYGYAYWQIRAYEEGFFNGYVERSGEYFKVNF